MPEQPMSLHIDPKYAPFVRLSEVAMYNGVCDKCGVAVVYENPFYAWLMEETDQEVIFIPLLPFTCPSCGGIVAIVRVFKSLDITKELEAINMNKKPDFLPETFEKVIYPSKDDEKEICMSALDEFNEWFGSQVLDDSIMQLWVNTLEEIYETEAEFESLRQENKTLKITLNDTIELLNIREEQIDELLTQLAEANEDAERLADIADLYVSALGEDGAFCPKHWKEALELHKQRIGE